jgi:hypothetical protein
MIPQVQSAWAENCNRRGTSFFRSMARDLIDGRYESEMIMMLTDDVKTHIELIMVETKSTQVRAIVRRIDLPTRTTGWFLSGDQTIIEKLIELLPPVGENFMVVWQEREINLRTQLPAIALSVSVEQTNPLWDTTLG